MASREADWLRQAARDLEQARSSVAGGFFEWACFAAHQAAEKAVKAVVECVGGAPWGHSVRFLLESLPSPPVVPPETLDHARELDHFYVPTRYPNGFPAGAPMDYYSRENAEDAVRRASALLDYCRGRLR
jgi:HEPN domain-containing protein